MYDKNGKPIEKFTQWDQNREIYFDEETPKENLVAHVFNATSKFARVVKIEDSATEHNKKVKIPNEFLQEAKRIGVHIRIKEGNLEKVIAEFSFDVDRQPRPDDYAFIENIEYTDWITLTEEARAFMTIMEESKTACDTAKANCEAATVASEKVNIAAFQDTTGVTIITTDREGKETECHLDEAVVHINTWKDVQAVVRAGLVEKLIKPGDIYNTHHTSPDGKTYELPYHVFDYRMVTLPNGEQKMALILQAHYLLPEDIVFDYYEAFYHADVELPAGTYHITIPDAWSKIQAGDSWSFTLTKPVPVGGVLTGFQNIASYGMESSYTVTSYATPDSLVEIESVATRPGAEGTKLGDLIAAGNELNSVQRVSYGYNRWRDSFARQFLNSEGKNFFKSQHKYDRPPTNVESYTGFLSCMDPELRAVISPVKVTTALNTVTDSADGTSEDTFDTVWLPSLEEMYIKPQAPGVEGTASPYWKEAIGLPEPREWYKDTPELVHLGVDDKRPHYVWFRSANRNYAYYVWCVSPSGIINSYHAARYEFRLAPLVAIV